MITVVRSGRPDIQRKRPSPGVMATKTLDICR